MSISFIISLFCFYLDALSISEIKVLKPLPINVWGSIWDLIFSNVSVTNMCVLVIGANMFRIKVSSWWNFLLMRMKYPSLYPLFNYGWKCILLYIRMAAPACFLDSLENFFPAFYFEVVSIFIAEVCFLYAAEWWILFSHPFC